MIDRQSSTRVIGALLSLLVGSVALAVDTTWTFNGDGNWTEAAKWSNGEPIDATFSVTIDDGNTAATVTLNESRTIGGLTLGADDILRIESLSTIPTALSASNGFTNDGSILLTGTSSGSAGLAIASGALTNSATGVLHFQTGGTGSRVFTGDLTNNGTVTVSRTTTFGGALEQAGGTLAINSTLTFAAGSALHLAGGTLDLNSTLNLGGSVFEQDGGVLKYTSGSINGGTYRYLGGTHNGVPALGTGGRLEIDPSAPQPASYVMRDGSVLASDIPAGHTITVQGTSSSQPVSVTAASSFSNNGSLVISGTNSLLTAFSVASGTLLNSSSGVIQFPSGGSAFAKSISGNVTNNGLVQVNGNGSWGGAGATFTNFNQIAIANAQVFSVGGTFNQEAGTIDVNGNAILSVSNSGVLNLNGGTIQGTGNLNASTGGKINLAGGSITMTGNINLSGGGELTGNGTITQRTTNNGTIRAAAGQTIALAGQFTNFSGTTLTGGTYDVAGTFGFAGANIVTNRGNIILRGTAGQILNHSNGNNALANMTTIGSGGALRLIEGRTYATTLAMLNQGEIELAGTSFDAPSLNIISNGTVKTSGTGTSTLNVPSVTNNSGSGGGLKVLDGGTLVVAGSLTNFSGDTLTGGVYDIAGTLRFPGAHVVNNNADIILRDSASIILNHDTGEDALTDLATIGASGAFRLYGGHNFVAQGAFNSAGQLELAGTDFEATTFSNNGVVRASSGQSTLAAGSVTNSASATMEALNGSTLNVAGPLTNLAGGILTGGVYRSVSTGAGASLAIPGTPVQTIAAGTTIELSGANSTITFGGTSIDASLTDNAGTLKILDGRALTLQNLNNTGSTFLAGGNTAFAANTLVNSPGGMFHVQSGSGANRTFTSDLTNNGTVTIDDSTIFDKAAGSYINNNVFSVNDSTSIANGGVLEQAAGTMTVNAALGLFNGSPLVLSGGTLDVKNTIDLNGGTFTQQGGTLKSSSGTISDGSFDFLGGTIMNTPQFKDTTIGFAAEPSSASSIVLLDSNTLTSNIHASQTLTIRNTSIVPKGLTSASSFTNAGTISLTATSSGSPLLTITNGTLTNSATGTLTFSSTSIPRLTADLVNNGSVQVSSATWLHKPNGQYTNNGAFSVQIGTLTIFGGTFEQAAGNLTIFSGATVKFNAAGVLNLTGGTLNNSGTLDLNGQILNQAGGTYFAATSNLIRNGTYSFLGGTVTGTPKLAESTLVIGPSATQPASFLMAATSGLGSNRLVGNIHSGQTMTLKARTPNLNDDLPTVVADTGFTNSGSIVFVGDSAASTATSNLTITDGTLINAAGGLMHFQDGPGVVTHIFRGNLLNEGTVTIDRLTEFDKPGGVYTNDGQFAVNSGLLIKNGGTFNQIGGTLNGGIGYTSVGTLNITGGTVGPDFYSGLEVNISGGVIGDGYHTQDGPVNISGGTVGAGFNVGLGGTVNLSGGTVNDGFHAGLGSTINIFGTQFSLGGSDITASLTPHIPMTITQRDIVLAGHYLSDGSAFDFTLNSTAQPLQDYFSSSATLTITLGVPGDFNNDGEANAADYVVWRKNGGTQAEFDIWRANFGATAGSGSGSADFGELSRVGASPSQESVPEPGSVVLMLLGMLAIGPSCRRYARSVVALRAGLFLHVVAVESGPCAPTTSMK